MVSRLPHALGGVACILLASASACSSTPSESASPPGSGLPSLHWKVQLARRGVASPVALNDAQFVRLFDDGRVVTSLDGSRGANRLSARDVNGVWKDVVPPASEKDSFITWYEDDANMGGYFQGAPSHGWVLADGVLHSFTGPPGFPRGRLPDGSYLLDSNINGGHYMQKWVFGTGPRDSLAVMDSYVQDQTKGRRFERLAANGTILLVPVGTASGPPSPQGVIANEIFVPLGPDVFNSYEPVDYAQEAIHPCCRVATIDRVRGGILGIKKGRPVIKVGETFDYVTEEIGNPYGVNGKGDVLYTSSDSKTYKAPRMRLGGKNYQFDIFEWSRVSRFNPDANSTGIPYIIDVNEKGQVLFGVQPASGENGWSLFVATPSFEPVPPVPLGMLTFTVKSGSKPVPAPLALSDGDAVVGSFAPTSLGFTAAVAGEVKGQGRALTVSVANGTKVPFVVGTAIPVTTTVTAAGSLVATVNYNDDANSVTTLASAGSLRVKGQTPKGGFVLAFENVELSDVAASVVYEVTGEATVLDPDPP